MADFIVNPQARDVDWTSKASYLFFNPRASLSQIKIFQSVIDQIKDSESYVWLFTSGSESHPKCVGLKKSAILSGAEALAKRYAFKPGETWINCLPSFHIGGLAIWARAYLSQQNVVETAWDLENLKQLFTTSTSHWMSLVPTQVYDLIRAGETAPKSLRGVFVGGGALPSDLDLKAKALGWPLLTTYGMTEASSQIATRTPQGSELQVLDHIEALTNDERRLGVRGESVTDKVVFFKNNKWELCDPRDQDKVYWTQDKVELKENCLKPLGRIDGFRKTRGELVSQFVLQARLEEVLRSMPGSLKGVITFKEDSRVENKICLVLEDVKSEENIQITAAKIKQSFNMLSAGFEKIENVYVLPSLPRSELGKVQYKKLEELLRSLNPL